MLLRKQQTKSTNTRWYSQDHCQGINIQGSEYPFKCVVWRRMRQKYFYNYYTICGFHISTHMDRNIWISSQEQ